MYLYLVERMLVSWSWIWWSRLMLCSAMADSSGCYRHMFCWCSLTLSPMEQLLCPHLNPLPSPIGPVKSLPCPTCFYISTHLFTCDWLITLMMEAVSTSETSANFYQTTRCNVPGENQLMKFSIFFILITFHLSLLQLFPPVPLLGFRVLMLCGLVGTVDTNISEEHTTSFLSPKNQHWHLHHCGNTRSHIMLLQLHRLTLSNGKMICSHMVC
jgi:hypothetical protein